MSLATPLATLVEDAGLAQDLAVRNCGLCGGEESSRLFESGGIPVVRCSRCQHVYARLQLRAPTSLYDHDYYDSVRRDGRRVAFTVQKEWRYLTERKTFSRRLLAIEARTCSKGRLLDVGCGLGEFLAVARARGWQVEGVEPSSYAAQRIRRVYEIPVYVGTLDTYPVGPCTFDVITLYDVIEHVPNPAQMLNQVYELLKPGGHAHLVTPNFRSMGARVLGKHWYHLKPLEHIHYFSPDTIHKLIETTEFQLLAVQPARHVMTPSYVLDRLRVYNQRLFGFLLAASKRLWDLGPAFTVSTGEMEVWLRKPAY